MTRAFGTTDCTGLHFVAYARDGLAWECFGTVPQRDQPHEGAAPGHLRRLLHHELEPGRRNRRSDQDVRRPGRAPGSRRTSTPTSGISDEAGCASGADHIIRQNLNGPILKNGDQADAIFYFSIGQHSTNIPAGGDGSSLKSLEGFDPNNEALIENGTYPLGYFFGNVYCTAKTGAAPCPRPANSAGEALHQRDRAGSARPRAARCPLGQARASTRGPDRNYRQEIELSIRADGFAPLTYGLDRWIDTGEQLLPGISTTRQPRAHRTRGGPVSRRAPSARPEPCA